MLLIILYTSITTWIWKNNIFRLQLKLLELDWVNWNNAFKEPGNVIPWVRCGW